MNTVPHPPLFPAGTIVTERRRLKNNPIVAAHLALQRKVYIVLGPSRRPGALRLRTWSHAARCWSINVRLEIPDVLAPAPDAWPQTKAVKRWLADGGRLP